VEMDEPMRTPKDSNTCSIHSLRYARGRRRVKPKLTTAAGLAEASVRLGATNEASTSLALWRRCTRRRFPPPRAGLDRVPARIAPGGSPPRHPRWAYLGEAIAR